MSTPVEILNDPKAKAWMAYSVACRADDRKSEVLFDFTSPRYAEVMEDARWMDAYAVGNFGQRDRCHHFCCAQRQLHAEGFRMVEVSTNIYGYCVCDTMNDGMGVIHGGRSRPGTAREEAIAWAREWHAERPTHRKVILGYEGVRS
jgi:hypothetical protein